VRERPNRTHC